MKNKLMFMCMSLMTYGSIVSSIGIFRPTITVLSNSLADLVKKEISDCVVSYNPEKRFWTKNGKMIAGDYVLNAMTKDEKNALEQYANDENYWQKEFNNVVSNDFSSINTNQELLSPDFLHSDSHSNESSHTIWTKIFGPLVAIITGTTTFDTAFSRKSANVEVSKAPFLEVQNDLNSVLENSTVVTAKIAPAASVFNVPLTWNQGFGYFNHDGKVALTAVTVGLTYLTYKAYRKGYLSKLNLFSKPVVESTKNHTIEKSRLLFQTV